LSIIDSNIYYASIVVRVKIHKSRSESIGNESAPIQLVQCQFPRLAISSAKI